MSISQPTPDRGDDSPKKIVVLGANAFSGQDFIDLLLDDARYEVIGVSRSPQLPAFRLKYAGRADLSCYRFMQLDMNRDREALLAMLDAEKPAYIVNFAAQSEVAPSWKNPEDWFATNCVALAGLVNHLRSQTYLERYLHISSPEVYGTCRGVVMEDARMNPSTPYAVSKAAADMLLDVYQRQYGFPLVSVRATNVYGARQQLFKIIPRSAIYLKLGNTIELHGGGKAVKSYIHIRDVSQGEKAILERGTIGQMYHLSPDEGVAVREVVASICRLTGKEFNDVVKTVDERPGQDAAYVIDSTKARTELDWRPRVSLEEGLREVVEWVEKEWPAIQEQSLDYQHRP
ncbi:MAG: GDP-mannose 4,6-dehydratase [Phycisphaeraceae bacterium]